MSYLQNNRIEKKFSQLKSMKQKGLICYVMGGYPNSETCEKIISSIVDGGADIIEIGIPFSDPIADGPVIQEASYQSVTEWNQPRQMSESDKKDEEEISRHSDSNHDIYQYFAKKWVQEIHGDGKGCRNRWFMSYLT